MQDLDVLRDLIENKRYSKLRNELSAENPADIAAFMETLPENKLVLVFRLLPKDLAADVFADLFSEMQQQIIESLSDREISFIIEELYLDDAVDFIEEMPAGVAKKVLANATKDTRDTINQLLNYSPNSAGNIMTVEYVSFSRELTVSECFMRIRRVGVDKETIYTCYVTDERRRLEGTVSAKRLLLSDPTEIVADIMNTNIIVANTTDDQEAVAHQFEKYDLLSIPVVDSENRLVGIITVDDIVDVVQEEATEDFEKMAAMLPSEKPYLRTGVLELAKNRILWLLILMFSGMITGSILGKFEAAIAMMPLLVTFIPMLTDTGGNAGSQSSTMVIRGMALHEVKASDFLKVCWKELRVSLLVGVLLSVINYVRVVIMYPGQELVAVTVGASLLLTVIIAQTLGGLLPILAKAVKSDPAVMAAPLITTIVDAISLFVFFAIASALLNL